MQNKWGEFNPTGTFNCNNLGFYYYGANTGGLDDKYMVIFGKDCPASQTMAIRLFGMEHQAGYLDFLQPSFADSCSPAFIHYIEPGYEIEMDSLISGSMNITTFTPRDSISEKLGKLEGTFEFTIANQDSIIHVTDGAFRFKVPNIW
ncbi:hypothetical protein G3O08_16855 [Cryomorpha ignava]|uniref:Uncharacterized protein n=1 Tax=Cryomorpha ignava TaxID=101383 RepID=A0A7K3WU23_9FLAO|nr:hypothetical protein [Cryomorpha ignava]NEN25173.1 hypothetical protein [Cryomorpha ignava]